MNNNGNKKLTPDQVEELVGKRNTVTIQNKLIQVDKDMAALNERLSVLENRVITMNNLMVRLLENVQAYAAGKYGTGPTER